MTELQILVLAMVQGLTEFLPISSTGHLRIVPAFLGWEDPGAFFTAVTQLGTMAAVVIYFRQDLWRIARVWTASLWTKSLRPELDARMGWYIIIATIPISVFGLAFRDQIETGARSLLLIGSSLILLGVVLWISEEVGRKTRSVEQVGLKDAVWVGFAQALALIPGVSRSGSTITAGLFLGLQRDAAARFSFLLSVPAVVLSGLFGLTEIFTGDEREVGIDSILIATVFAFIAGYAAIAFLLRYLVSHSTLIFVIYRIGLGVIVIGLAAAGVIS